MRVILRPFDASQDSGIIFDSYPKGVYFKSFYPIGQSKTKWMKWFYARVKEQLSQCDVRVACSAGDPNTLVGYSIISKNGVLYFVYVKSDYRNKGIGNLLTKNKFLEIHKETLTRVGHSILENRRKKEKHENAPKETREE